MVAINQEDLIQSVAYDEREALSRQIETLREEIREMRKAMSRG